MTERQRTGITRDFTVAVFVVHDGAVLLHWHRKLGRWLPPGGHIEPDELPDEAARREVMEETGVPVALVGPTGIAHTLPGEPVQLVRPEGIQLETIGPGHEHIDLIYFARPLALPVLPDQVGWYGADDLDGLGLTNEVRQWCVKALATMGEPARHEV
jgi:8-oxo-dGTP pyrophosphatase MutT (NUDIX family)